MKISAALIIGITTLLILPLRISYAQQVSLGVHPPVIQIDATRPASINAPITIENNGEEPVSLDVQLRAFTASPNQDGHVQYYPLHDPRSTPPIFKKIQITENGHPKKSISLPPGEKKQLVMHIGITKNEPITDYYFSVVFVSKQAATEADRTSSQTPAGIATNVLLSLGPKGPTTGEIEQFSSPLFIQGGPVPFTVKIKNTSNHVLTPKGEILITNMFGQTIGRVDLLPVNILANTTRIVPDDLQFPLATPSAATKERLEKVINNWYSSNEAKPVALWPEDFLLGPYTAQLTIALSDQGPVYRRSIYFFALPLYILIGIIMLLIIGVYVLLRVRKRMRQVK